MVQLNQRCRAEGFPQVFVITVPLQENWIPRVVTGEQRSTHSSIIGTIVLVAASVLLVNNRDLVGADS